jgi:hypothetical protein
VSVTTASKVGKKPETEIETAREVFEKYYVKVALRNQSAIVSLAEIDDEAHAHSEDDAEAVHEFAESDEYYEEWMIFPFEDFGDLVAVPSLAKKLKEMGLDKVVAWMYVNDVDKEKIEKFIHDVTLSCLTVNEHIRDVLALAEKHYRVEADYSKYNKHNYSGEIVYSIYDSDGKLLGKITESVWYCNRCVCDGIFHNGPGCYENWIQKCVAWYFGEPKDKE